jgi:light-regulated signal transduction histidine kinase (bacteriophytochrome)
MNDRHYTYEQLQQKLADSEALIEALRKHEVDAIVGENSVAVVRLREVEEQLVEARRTAEERAGELEAFSYSVSHDLRAPLRAIKGFAGFLSEDYSAVLDETGRDYLKRIDTGIDKMTGLIDDMLELSKVSRHELHREEFDLCCLARDITSELSEYEPQRKVHITICEEMKVRADRKLMTIALTNLIRNAWKFTSKKPDACIEIGITETEEGKALFIRDNGAGFDMKHMQKMFGAFQRLHSENEFPGTGVGLAIVKRVISKHGGKVWAEGEPGKGATFYFIIP